MQNLNSWERSFDDLLKFQYEVGLITGLKISPEESAERESNLTIHYGPSRKDLMKKE